MNFLELAKARYSVRSFKNQPVEDEKLSVILEAGKAAPTAVNRQPIRVYVLKSAQAMEKIRSACKYTYGAPLALLVCYDLSRVVIDPATGRHSGEMDASIVCTHMMLAAWEQGVGSCWVGGFDADEVAATFSLPKEIRPCALLPLGYAADDAKPSARHAQCRPDEELFETL